MESTAYPGKFIDAIKNLSFVDRIILFGSRARGDAAPKVDIDKGLNLPLNYFGSA
jgi:predicted nucleotidyltransferase